MPLTVITNDMGDEELLAVLLEAQENIKSIHPSDPTGQIYDDIARDNAARLEHSFMIGEFDKDLNSKNARLLQARGNSGLQTILYQCVDFRAHRCMMFLIEWTKREGNPYWYDQKALFKYAKEAALAPEAKMSCLLALMEAKLTEENIQELSLRLFPNVRSSSFAIRVHNIMVENIYNSTLPALIEQCGQRYSQPSLISTLISMVRRRGEDINRIHMGRMIEGTKARWSRTALSEACHSLNIGAVQLLLQNHADPRVGAQGPPASATVFNPMFRLLSQEELEVPVPEIAPSGPEDQKILHADDNEVYDAIGETGYRMVNCLQLMLDAYYKTPMILDVDEFVNMTHQAIDIYGETLRNYTISTICRHLPPSVQRTLLETKTEPTRIVYAPQPRHDRPPPKVQTLKFLDTLNGTQLEEILTKYSLLPKTPLVNVWSALVSTSENIEWLHTVIKDRIEKPRTTDSSWDLLFEFLLDPQSRPAPPVWDPLLGPDETSCFDEFSD